MLVHGRWFYTGTQASSTTKTGRHDIAEILLKVALNTINQSITYLLSKKTITVFYFCQYEYWPRWFPRFIKNSFWPLQKTAIVLIFHCLHIYDMTAHYVLFNRGVYIWNVTAVKWLTKSTNLYMDGGLMVSRQNKIRNHFSFLQL